MSRLESEWGVVRGKGVAVARTERINLGLTLLQMAAQPGVPLSRKDQAAWCECGESAIFVIEQKALRKLRKRLLYLKDPRLIEAIEHLLAPQRQSAARKETA